MKAELLDITRFDTPTTDAPHELAAAVNLIKTAGLVTKSYDYAFWLRKVWEAGFDHPEEEVRRLIERMEKTARYFRLEKHQELNKGGWLTNRLKEGRS
jgi:hypothetical protein